MLIVLNVFVRVVKLLCAGVGRGARPTMWETEMLGWGSWTEFRLHAHSMRT